VKAAQLRNMARGELEHRLEELLQEQFNLRFQMASRQLADTSRIREVRREIARVKTVITELAQDAEV